MGWLALLVYEACRGEIPTPVAAAEISRRDIGDLLRASSPDTAAISPQRSPGAVGLQIHCPSINQPRPISLPAIHGSRVRRFLDANRRLSARLDTRRDVSLYQRYDADVGTAIDALPPRATVIDVGAGRHCSFADQLVADRSFRLVAVDISPEELAANASADETRIGDVADRLPFANGEVDLVVSRTVLEHVESVDAAAREMARVLRAGGRSIHLLPCRYALFALAARLIPFSVAKRLVHKLLPESQGVVEFDVFYDQCHPAALERAFLAAGFSRVNVECTWDQSGYFHPFFPAFLMVLAYQRIVEALGLRILASYVVVHAER